jgi:hypothetical protein
MPAGGQQNCPPVDVGSAQFVLNGPRLMRSDLSVGFDDGV